MDAVLRSALIIVHQHRAASCYFIHGDDFSLLNHNNHMRFHLAYEHMPSQIERIALLLVSRNSLANSHCY